MLRSVLVAAAALSVVGCSDSTAPSPTEIPDVTALLSEMSLSGVRSAASAALPTVGADITSFTALDPGGCSYTSSTGYFVCPTVTVNGLTFTRMFRLIDDSGNSQSKPGANTSAIETKSTVNGMVTSAETGTTRSIGSYTVTGSSDETLSGIRTRKHTLNGVSATSIRGIVQLATTTIPIDMSETETTADLVLPNTKAGQRWPQSGSITLGLSINESGDPSLAQKSKAVITFNGTSVVTMKITTAFGTITCQFDLASPPGAARACLP